MKYKTISGDTFDKIAKSQYGDEKLAINIMEANLQYANIIIFQSGITLEIPDAPVIQNINLPPWKRGITSE